MNRVVSELDESTRAAAAYYDEMQRFYGRLWHPSGVHYGYWGAGATSHDESIAAMDALVVERLGLSRGSRVLDAGCGVGGTTARLANEYGMDVVGITVSLDQLRRARMRTATSAERGRMRFELRSYVDTGFEAASFEGVFGIESVCYAEPKVDFLREAYRILRPGGSLVVADGFATERPPARDRDAIRAFCDGFAVRSLATPSSFADDARRAGFVFVDVDDITDRVLPSAKRIERLARLGAILLRGLTALGVSREAWRRHCEAGLVQRRLFERRSIRYCVIRAIKPGATGRAPHPRRG